MNKSNIASMRRLVLAGAIAAAGVPLLAQAAPGWFGSERVQGSGVVRKESRALGHFSGLSVSVPGSVELRLGNTEGVTIEADDNVLPLIETVVDGDTLDIRPARHMNLRTRTLRIVVQAKAVDSIALAGSGTVDADALRAPKLRFDLGGSGTINVKGVEAENLAVTVGGSGDLKTGGGNARKVSVSIGGSGSVDVGRVKAAQASVDVAGSGEATVWATGALNVSIAGSGDVNYYGDPQLNRSVIGSGEARRLGAAPH